MIVLSRILNSKTNRNQCKKTFHRAHSKIPASVEGQSVMPRQKCLGGRQKIVDPAVDVRNPVGDCLPTGCMGFAFEDNGDAGSRFAGCRIENMCCDGAHFSKSLFSRISVIFFCSSAAICSSVLREFRKRA